MAVVIGIVLVRTGHRTQTYSWLACFGAIRWGRGEGNVRLASMKAAAPECAILIGEI